MASVVRFSISNREIAETEVVSVGGNKAIEGRGTLGTTFWKFYPDLDKILRAAWSESALEAGDEIMREMLFGEKAASGVYGMDTLGAIVGCGMTFGGQKFIGTSSQFEGLKEANDEGQRDLVIAFLGGKRECREMEERGEKPRGFDVNLYMCRKGDEQRAYMRVKDIRMADEDRDYIVTLSLCEKC